MKTRSIQTMAVVAALALAGPVLAQEVGDVIFRGFGGWVAGNSDAYEFLAGPGGGETEWENAEFALNLTAHPHERLRIQAQFWAGIDNEGTESELDLAFAEWTFSDALHLRGGVSRQPFGIYADILEVGTLRPFYYLPQSVYGEIIGAVSENYMGIGLWGRAGDEWSVVYDVYLGEMRLEEMEPWKGLEGDVDRKLFQMSEEEGMERFENLENILGLRLVFDTPVEGLSFGFSAYAGKPEAEVDEEEGEVKAPNWGDQKAFGVQLEYLTGPFLLRTEYVLAQKNEDIDSYYLELAYTMGEHWQLATSYDNAKVDLGRPLDEGESLLNHAGWALGVNYWFAPQMVFKLSYYDIDGNLLMHPHGHIAETIEAGQLEESNHLITLGIQFSF